MAENEIILVDNASDNEMVSIKQEFPTIKIIENKVAVGFGEANNQALSLARGEYLFLLNNDTVLVNDAVKTMADFLDKNQQAGAVTCKLFEADGITVQKNCRSFPTPFGTFFGRASLLTRIFPKNPWSVRNLLADSDYESEKQVDWCSGAAIMVKRKVYEKTGGFDNQTFFMYWEDTDWCKRIRDAGWQIWFNPNAKIIHLSGKGGTKTRSLLHNLRMMWHLHFSAYKYFRKHYYASAFHPMSILLLLGMLALVFMKATLAITKAALHRPST
jgi:GT2 family glycosyltransferase